MGECGRFARRCFVLSFAAALCALGAEDKSVITENDKDCGVKWSNQSAHFPDCSPGKTVNMYCEVEFSDPSVTAANPTWKRSPLRPHHAPPANVSFTYQTSGNLHIVNLTVRNVTDVDVATYTLAIGGDCLFECNITLKVLECLGIPPQPTTQHNITITASLSDSSVSLVANFTGETTQLTYPIIFSNRSVNDLLLYQSKKYSFESHIFQKCVRSVVLVIHNLSMGDAGLYTARAIGLGHSSREVFFDVKVIDPGTDKNILLPLISLVAMVVVFVAVILCVGVCVHRRKKGRRYYPDDPLIVIPRDELCTQPTSNRRSVLILYCGKGIMREALEELLELLDMFPGIEPHIDFRVRHVHEQYPDNWTRWMQTELESCDHILIICSESLQQAFRCSNRGHSVTEAQAPDPQNGVVEMFQGHFNASAVIECIEPSKSILVFLGRPKDPAIAPLPQLKDRRSFELNLSHLLATVQDDHTLLTEAIKYDRKFRDFKDLIQHLQH